MHVNFNVPPARMAELWEAAMREVGNLDEENLVAALGHARISEGPGGATEMVSKSVVAGEQRAAEGIVDLLVFTCA